MQSLPHFKSWFALVVMAALVACTPREVKVVNHETPVETEPVVYAPHTEVADDAKLQAVNLAPAKSRSFTADVNAKFEILKSLQGFMLNANYVENPRFKFSAKMREMLTIWNQALLAVLSSGPLSAESKAWVDKATVMMLSGCDEDLKGCVSLSFYKQDPNSAHVLERRALLVDAEIDAATEPAAKDLAVKRYYRYLMISFDLRNRVSDPQFEFMYLSRARTYAEAIHRDQDQGKAQLALARHTEVFEMILNRFNPENLDAGARESFRGFVDHFQPWDYSRLEANTFGDQAATKMLELAAKGFMYETDANGTNPRLSKSLTAAIAKSQEKDGSQCPPVVTTCEMSITKIFAKLQAEHPLLVQNLGLSNDFPRDEYFFIIDRLFNDHLTPDDASAIWQGSRRENDKLLLTLEKYLKTQLAWLVVKTNAYMSAVYANKDGFTSQNLFVNAIEKSYPLSTEWNLMIGKIARIGVFVDRHMKAAGQEVEQTDDFKRIDDMLTSLSRNIKFLSVYPNMMMMAYFMQAENANLRVYTMWGALDIDTETIISMFFEGKLTPFFNFGNDPEPIMRLETLYAFYFALKTETFQAFSSASQPINENLFFERVITKYLASTRRDLEDQYRSLWTKFSSDQGYPLFLLTCAQDRAAIAQGTKPGMTGTTQSMELDNLRYYTYMSGTSSSAQNNAQAAFGLYADSTLKSLTQIRDELREKRVFANSLIEILDTHLAAMVQTSANETERAQKMAERTQKIAAIRQMMAKETDIQVSLLTEILKRHRESSDCVTQTMKIEFDRQYDLGKKEESYLRDVYRRMKAARDSQFAKDWEEKNKPAKIGALSDLATDYPVAVAGEKLPDGYFNHDTFSADEYSSWTLELLLRLRVFMKSLAPNASIKLPPDLTDSDLWKNNSDLVLPGALDEEAFVRLGMQRFNSFVTWQGATADFTPLKNRLQLLVELYRLGDIEIFDWSTPACAQSPTDASCPRIKVKVPAKEVLDELRSTIQLVSLTENGMKPKRDVELLQKMGITNRFPLTQLQNFFLDDKNQPLTFAETLFASISDDAVAVSDAKEYYATVKSLGSFLFTPDNSVTSVMRKMYRPLVMNSFRVGDDFASAVREMEKTDSAGGTKLELGYEISGNQVLTIQAPQSGDSVMYLSRQKMDDFETRKSMFHKETGNEFLPKKGDDDFADKAAH